MREVRSSPHNHLRTTSNITAKIADKAVKKASKKLRLGGILGVINFNPSPTEIDPRWDLFKKNLRYDKVDTLNGLYLPQFDLLVVRGQEVLTSEGYHVLIIGTTPDQNIPNRTTLEKTLNLADEFEAKKDVDHPFHLGGLGKFLQEHPDFYKRFHSYETHNALAATPLPGCIGANKKAQEEFKRIKDTYPNLSESSTDDGHSVWEIGRSFSTITMPRNYEKFRGNPKAVSEALMEGYLANRNIPLLEHKRKPSIPGAVIHRGKQIITKNYRKLLR